MNISHFICFCSTLYDYLLFYFGTQSSCAYKMPTKWHCQFTLLPKIFIKVNINCTYAFVSVEHHLTLFDKSRDVYFWYLGHHSLLPDKLQPFLRLSLVESFYTSLKEHFTSIKNFPQSLQSTIPYGEHPKNK